jgi:hypothetical protein
MSFLSTYTLPVSLLLYLVNVAAAAVIVGGGGLFLDRMFRRASLPFRHLLLVGALAGALVAPVIVGVILSSGQSLLQLNVSNTEKSPSSTMPSSASRTDGSFSALDRPPTESGLLNQSAAVRQTAEAAPTTLPAPTGHNGSASGDSSWARRLQVVGTVLTIGWLAGSVALSRRLMQGLLQLRRLSRGLRPLNDDRVTAIAATTARQLRLRKVPTICESNAVLSPLSIGMLRPFVVLPVGIASSFSANQLRGLVLHEFAHIVRRDHLVGALQRLTTILFWWNLPIHRASARVSEIREQICDDVSTGAGSADDYAAMLVELAGRVAYSRPLPATIGLFDGATGVFTQRIRRLLNPHRKIVTNLDGRSKLLAAACSLLLLLPTAVPLDVQGAAVENSPPPVQQVDEPNQPNQSPTEPEVNPSKADAEDRTRDAPKAPEASPIKWPKRLRGVIKDANGQPIVGATVRLDFEKIYEYSIGRWDEVLESQSQVTGSDGEYSFDASNFARLTHRPFVLMMTCTAEGYADTKWWSWYTRSDNNLEERLTDVKMLPGRVVRGRCVDPQGDPISGAIVKMAASYDSRRPTAGWSWDPRETSADGAFEFSVPRDGEGSFEIWAIHPQWAPQRVALPRDGDALGDIHLQPGAPIHGTVRAADGSPISGAVVVAESVDSGDLESVAFSATVATKTDAQGNYAIQPLLGAYKVYLSQAEEIDNRLKQRFIVADGPPPLVVPARLDVSAGQPQLHDIHGGPTLKVSGTVRWEDGRPVQRCEVRADYLPPDNGTGIWIARTLTDEQGNYTIELPNPIDNVSIHVVGAHDKRRVWHSAHPAESVNAKQKSEQNIQLIPLDGDLNGMDWVLQAD